MPAVLSPTIGASDVESSASASSERVALLIQYQGTHFHGWQRQANGRTVQEEIEGAIASVLGHRAPIQGAGRTDAGVHAAAQVAHFNANTRVPAHRWRDILNTRLPDDIVIRASTAVESTWHAQYSASWRRYRYTIYSERCPNLFVRPFSWHYYHAPLDVERMQAALDPLVGYHHLAAFQRAGSARKDAWVELQEATCVRRGAFVQVELQARGFLYGMVRLLMGMLVEVGNGERAIAQFTQLWQEERRNEVRYAAPPQGLCLLRVGYPNPPFPTHLWYDTQPQFLLPDIPTPLESTDPLPYQNTA